MSFKAIGRILIDLETDYEEAEVNDVDFWDVWRKKTSNIYLGINKDDDSVYIAVKPNCGIVVYFCFDGNLIYVIDRIENVPYRPKVAQNKFEEFLAYGYMPGKDTLFENLECIPSGYYAKIPIKHGEITYDIVKPSQINNNLSLETVIRNNCPVMNIDEAAYLGVSGGLDSSVLYDALNKNGSKVNYFSVKVKNGRDEQKYQRMLLQNEAEIQEFKMTEKDAWDAFCTHGKRNDLFGHPIVMKYEYMMKKLHDIGGRVLITGDGPDELFVCKETYEKYIDERAGLYRPINKQVCGHISPLTLPQYDSEAISIWCWYNLIFQGHTNVKYLHQIAKSVGIKLSMPYLNIDMYEYCLLHVNEMQYMNEKQLLREYASDRIPEAIINRRKMGYSSDFACWIKKGNLFNQWIEHELSKKQIPVLEQYKKMIFGIWEREKKSNFDPQKSTGGINELSFLFSYMMLVNFYYEHS